MNGANPPVGRIPVVLGTFSGRLIVPGRRRKKGSFATDLDELVKHFNHEPPQKPAPRKLPQRAKRKSKIASIHQALFERAGH